MKTLFLSPLLLAALAWGAEPAKDAPPAAPVTPFYDPAAPAPTVDPTKPAPEPSLPAPEKTKPTVPERKKKKKE